MGGGGTTVVAGGGSSGRVEYPTYMQSMHSSWLNSINSFLVESNNPYTNAFAYNPDAYLDAMLSALNAMTFVIAEMCTTYIDIDALTDSVNDFDTKVKGIDVGVDWDTYYDIVKAALTGEPTFSSISPTSITLSAEPTFTIVVPEEESPDTQVVSNTEIANSVNAATVLLSNEVDTYQVPKFEAGMRDINAVVSSAFVVGKALLHSQATKHAAKLAADLYLRAHEINANWVAKKNELVFAQTKAVNDMNISQQIKKAELSYQWAAEKDRLSVSQQGAINTLNMQQELKKNELAYGYVMESNKISSSGGVELVNAKVRVSALYKEHAELVKSIYLNAVQFKLHLTQTAIDTFRISIVAKKEETDENLRLDLADSKWILEKYQAAGNLLASIHGTAVSPEVSSKQNAVSSVLGGSLSGAGMGAAIGGLAGGPIGAGIGAGIGAIIGGIGGFLDL